MYKKSRFMTLGMIAALSLAMSACGNNTAQTQPETTAETQAVETEAAVEETKAPSSVTDCVVTPMQVGENEVLVVYPTPNVTAESPLSVTCTAPVFAVFGDGKYDAESAKQYVMESGLADVAAEEGASVCVINPVGDAWSDADAAAYEGLVGMIDDSSTSQVKDGISTSVNFMTKEEEQKISGTAGRVYVYGVGTGADFVAKNFVKPVKSSVTYPDGFTMEFDRTATGVTLVGATDASGIEANDMTVVSIYCSEEVNAALEANCGSVVKADSEDFVANYPAVAALRRQAGLLIPVFDWEAEGIVEKVETYTVETSADNVTFAGSETHDINYATYYASDLDVENGNVPLVLCFHGGGNTALFEAQATQWPLIGKEHGFITVSVDLHFPNVTAKETVDLIEHLKEEYSIDSSRIYASGFSMGGCKSWDLFEQYPEVFAGLAPMDATAIPGEDSFGNQVAEVNKDTLTPVFYVGGETSPLPELPCQEDKVVKRVDNLFTVNKVTNPYDVTFEGKDSWENKTWGVNGDMTYAVTAKDFTDSVMTVSMFASEDGKYYTALALAGNMSHEVYARNSWAAWDFLSQFSRESDGSIKISDVTYSMPADDGSVVDNTYNK